MNPPAPAMSRSSSFAARAIGVRAFGNSYSIAYSSVCVPERIAGARGSHNTQNAYTFSRFAQGDWMRDIALCMELTDFYDHGIARGVVRYAKGRPDWRLYGYGWMFRPLADLKSWKGHGVISRVET